MSESNTDKLGRLRAMCRLDQDTWDLSDNDRAAIQWVVSCHDELLAACHAVIDDLDNHKQLTPSAMRLVRVLANAIAKATGESC